MKIQKKLTTPIVMLFLLGFIIFWIFLTDAWGVSKLIFSNHVIVGAYIYGYITRIIWLLPAIFLIHKYKKNLSIHLDTLLSKPRLNKFFILTLSIMAIYCFVGMFAMNGGFNLNTDNFVYLLIKVLIVGIVEETVFRGWGYNVLCSLTTQKKAMILSSLMFALIHCPAYIIKFIVYGHFDFLIMLQQFFIAFILGILFCLLLRKGKSLWCPIIGHSFYDLLTFLML